jgi:hypothetical protein
VPRIRDRQALVVYADETKPSGRLERAPANGEYVGRVKVRVLPPVLGRPLSEDWEDRHRRSWLRVAAKARARSGGPGQRRMVPTEPAAGSFETRRPKAPRPRA